MIFQLDGTFWVQLLNFGVFFVALNFVFLRPVGAAVVRRRAAIEALAREIDEAEAKVAVLRREAEAGRAAGRREADHVMASERKESERQVAAITARFESQAAAKIEAAHQTVAAELVNARAKEAQIIGDLASGLLNRALSGRS